MNDKKTLREELEELVLLSGPINGAYHSVEPILDLIKREKLALLDRLMQNTVDVVTYRAGEEVAAMCNDVANTVRKEFNRALEYEKQHISEEE